MIYSPCSDWDAAAWASSTSPSTRTDGPWPSSGSRSTAASTTCTGPAHGSRREAAALAALDHPGIVPLLEVVDDGDDIVLVMPYLAGGTLADQVRAHGPLTPTRSTTSPAACSAPLAAAHRAGIVHRDIKPANVLFDEPRPRPPGRLRGGPLRDATVGPDRHRAGHRHARSSWPPSRPGASGPPPASDVFSLGATLALRRHRHAALRPRRRPGHPQPGRRGQARPPAARAARARSRDRLTPLLDKRPERRPTAAAAAQGAAGGTVALPAGRPTPGASSRSSRPPVRLAHGVERPPAPGCGRPIAAVVLVALVGVDRHRARRGPQPIRRQRVPTRPPPSPPKPVHHRVHSARLPGLRRAGRAPFTDGLRCIDDHADYDGNALNGCEAAPDTVDGTTLTKSLTANLVPTDDIDRYPFHVIGLLPAVLRRLGLGHPHRARRAWRCGWTSSRATPRSAPPSAATARPATVDLPDPSCLGDDSTDLQARVSWVGDDRTATPYRLERAGSY